MSTEIDKFQFDPLAPKSKTPETIPPIKDQQKSSPEGIGNTIKAEFTSPEDKRTVATEFADSFSKRITEFSQEFQKAFCDKAGKVDLNKILSLFGLENIFKDQIDSTTEKPKPLATISNTTRATPTPAPQKLESKPTFSNGKIPERPINALTGSQFLESQKGLSQSKMEQAIFNEIDQGNIPSFCRSENMKRLTIEKNGYKVTYKAALDYLSIGSDTDYIRIPITPLLAQKLAKKYNWGIPTASITEHIYKNANIKLEGKGYLTGEKGSTKLAEQQSKMQSTEYIQKHSLDIDKQISKLNQHNSNTEQLLVAGHKKDVIVSQYAINHPGNLDMRGLYINGQAVQKNPAHQDTYRDYSHGFRPIGGNLEIIKPDGTTETIRYYDGLKIPEIAEILNGKEGAIDAESAYSHPA